MSDKTHGFVMEIPKLISSKVTKDLHASPNVMKLNREKCLKKHGDFW